MKLRNREIVDQSRKYAICHEEFHGTQRHRGMIRIPREWEARGETTTQTMFEQRIGGATERKGRVELATDGRSVAMEREEKAGRVRKAWSKQEFLTAAFSS